MIIIIIIIIIIKLKINIFPETMKTCWLVEVFILCMLWRETRKCNVEIWPWMYGEFLQRYSK